MAIKNPNPQGKGQLPTLQALHAIREQTESLRSKEELLLDYMAGALVLSSRFSFKPIVHKSYYLYWTAGRWSLSMVSPREWGPRLHSLPVAKCVLRTDLSWQLSALEHHDPHPQVIAALAEFQQGFRDQLDTDQPLADGLPYYDAGLPWYPRLMALALSKSLQTSLKHLPGKLQTGRALLNATSAPQHFLPGT